jgi:hypothetical protein
MRIAVRKVVIVPSSAVSAMAAKVHPRTIVAIIAAIVGLSFMLPGTAMASEPSGPPGSTVPITADGTSGGYNLYDIYQGESGYIEHVCETVGPVVGDTRVACVDVYAYQTGTKNVEVFVGFEGFCQGPSGYLQCNSASIDGYAYVDSKPYKGLNGVCTACNAGSRNYFYTDVVTLNNPGDCHNFEGILDYADIGVETDYYISGSYVTTATARICDES